MLWALLHRLPSQHFMSMVGPSACDTSPTQNFLEAHPFIVIFMPPVFTVAEMQRSSSPKQLRVLVQSVPVQVKHFLPLGVALVDSGTLWELQRSVLQHLLAIVVREIPKFIAVLTHSAGTVQDFALISTTFVSPA